VIRAIIFDLDSCLSAADEVGRQLYDPVFRAIRAANHGTLSEEELEKAFTDCWRIPFDVVAETHGFSPEMRDVGWREFAGLEIQDRMVGYPDLPAIWKLPVLRFLVTSGFRRLQESKVRALGFAEHFTAIHVDAIDEPAKKGKQRIFEEILATHHLSPSEVLVVGDNPDSEIDAGNRLGITTVQILREGVPRGTNATRYIHTLDELTL
jgi:FMN phosphatase YigB (HAD superfamily)